MTTKLLTLFKCPNDLTHGVGVGGARWDRGRIEEGLGVTEVGHKPHLSLAVLERLYTDTDNSLGKCM